MKVYVIANSKVVEVSVNRLRSLRTHGIAVAKGLQSRTRACNESDQAYIFLLVINEKGDLYFDINHAIWCSFQTLPWYVLQSA